MKSLATPVSGLQKKARTFGEVNRALWVPRLFFGAVSPLLPGLAAARAERMFFTPERHDTPDAERALLSTGHAFRIEAQGSSIQAWNWEASRADRVAAPARQVYLLHGWAGRAGQMSPLVRPLLDAGFDVVTFDAPGHGASSGEMSSLVEFARALKRVVDWCGPAYAVIGHSMGGAATALALHEGLKAKRAAFIGTPGDPTEFVGGFQKLLGISEPVMARMRERAAKRLGFEWGELAIESFDRDSQIPLLVVHDEQDKEVKVAEAHRIARSWPGARVELTSGLGHRRILRDAGVGRQIVDFLR